MKKYAVITIFVTISIVSLAVSWNKTKTVQTTGVLKIACVGDSNTRGYLIPNVDENCYPGKLQSILGDEYLVENFGVGGTCVLKHGRIPYWKTRAIGEALKFEPDVVIFGFGGNDLLPQDRKEFVSSFVIDYVALIWKFKKLPSKPQIYIIGPIASQGSPDADRMNSYLLPLLKIVAFITGAVDTIDLYNPIKNNKLNFVDGSHMSIRGVK